VPDVRLLEGEVVVARLPPGARCRPACSTAILSTFDTDHLLVPAADAGRALEALRAAA
jgi:hypothetical protein